LEDAFITLITVLWAALVLYLVLWLYVLLPAGMAKKRGRSQAIWVVVSVLVTPFLAILLLWAFRDAET